MVKLRKSYFEDLLTEDVEWIEVNRIDSIKKLRIEFIELVIGLMEIYEIFGNNKYS